MRRFAAILGVAAVVSLALVFLWRLKTPPTTSKILDIIVTYVGLTNDAHERASVIFRISNPYSREIWYIPPKWGSTNIQYRGPWQHPFRFLGPYQSDTLQIIPPPDDPGTNHWRVNFRSGVTQGAIQKYTDPIADKLRGNSPRYGDDIRSVEMQGLRPTPDGALISGIVEGNEEAVSRAIAEGANLARLRGLTMLHLTAMYSGSTNVARVLLRNGVGAFALDRDRETALDIAKRNGHSGLANLLEDFQHDSELFPAPTN